jgi:phosphatidate cytidylyltransferase
LKELFKRSVTGAIFAVVLLGAVLLGPWTFFVLYGLLGLLSAREFSRNSLKHSKNRFMLIIGLIYILLPFTLMYFLAYNPYHEGYSPDILVFMLLTIWGFDTFAYLVGARLGKHPLIKISPKKTWEGLIGGIILTGFGIWFLSALLTAIPNWHLWIMGAVIILFGNLGDLIESAWKRNLGIKDSGKILPGHGGWLDRFDSMLLAIPFVYLCLRMLN